jgi:hypothetical protein
LFPNSISSLILDNSHFIDISSPLFSLSSSSAAAAAVLINETEFKNIESTPSIEGGGMRIFSSLSSYLNISSSSFKQWKGKGENSKGEGMFIKITEIEENSIILNNLVFEREINEYNEVDKGNNIYLHSSSLFLQSFINFSSFSFFSSSFSDHDFHGI